ncbi:hypothetical protein Pint_26723 [Pistacia integerrima]|uniref:Uncharacterized protein n=1 Tax=Pistacia integerrima TaxID=434235 RepID=A0ACC0YQK5_9ROSI|nr:hypothetical protein Pint_26723 [Pistacia integerrima]
MHVSLILIKVLELKRSFRICLLNGADIVFRILKGSQLHFSETWRFFMISLYYIFG